MSDNERQNPAEEPSEATELGDQQTAGRATEGTAEQGRASSGKASQESAAEALEGELADEDAAASTEAGAGDMDEEMLRQRVEELEAALAEAQQKAQENWDQVLRMRAELENAQRRAEKDTEQAKRQSLEKIVNDLLQVKDSLEMGVRAAEDAEADQEKLLEGSQLTLKMMDQVFERFEIEEINPQGERFNPDYHEAMSTQATDEQEPNTVVQVIQKGYRLKERLLRPALVVVAKKGDGSSTGGSVDESA